MQHDAPIKCIAAVQELNCVVTGSWDKTVKYWDTRSPNAVCSVQLSERCYAMDTKQPLLVVATADRQVHVYDMRNPQQPYKSIPSNLKFQTRTIACFPDASGFAVGSIEGRVAVQHVEEKDKRCSRCHWHWEERERLMQVFVIAETTSRSSAIATAAIFIP